MPGLDDDSVQMQELHCHSCGKYVQFKIDLALDGNHVLNCPNCGHEHCRVVKDGVITEERWDSRNVTYPIQWATYSVNSAANTVAMWYTMNSFQSVS